MIKNSLLRLPNAEIQHEKTTGSRDQILIQITISVALRTSPIEFNSARNSNEKFSSLWPFLQQQEAPHISLYELHATQT